MKKYFITGLVILLPLAITIAIVAFIVGVLTDPFVGFIEHFFRTAPWYPPLSGILHLILQILLLIFLFFFTVGLGFFGRMIAFKSLLSLYDYMMHRIPIIKTVYKATQQVIKGILGTSTKSFKQVVMVPFPVTGAYAIGLVSGSAPTICEKTLGTKLVTVFVPTTPNPTSGYLMLYKSEDVIYLDMKTEEAIKYVISCGVVTSDVEGVGPVPMMNPATAKNA
jgi:uncharacterized membrane protein